MFRKLILTAVCVALTATAATAQEPQWKLGVVLTSLGGGDRGVVVNQVIGGSPAEQMGLEAGDVLVTVNGQLAADPLAVRATVFASESVSLVLKRGNQYFQKDVTFGLVAPPPGGGGEPQPIGGTTPGSGGTVVTSAPPVAAAYAPRASGPKPAAAPPAPQKVVKSVQTRAVNAPTLPPVKAPTPTKPKR